MYGVEKTFSLSHILGHLASYCIEAITQFRNFLYLRPHNNLLLDKGHRVILITMTPNQMGVNGLLQRLGAQLGGSQYSFAKAVSNVQVLHFQRYL